MNRIEEKSHNLFPEPEIKSEEALRAVQHLRAGFQMGAYWWQEQLLNKAKVWFNEHANIPYEVETNENDQPLASSYIDYAKKRLEAANEMFEALKAFVES